MNRFRRTICTVRRCCLRYSGLQYSLVFGLSLWATAVPASDAPRDGRLFDPGVQRTERASTAPEELDRVTGMIGDWDVSMELARGDEVLQSTGRSRITFMNRGHGLMERTQIDDFDGEGHSVAAMAFFVVDANGSWSLSEGDSWTESIAIFSGGFEEDALVLYDALRPGGGPSLVALRRSYQGLGSSTITMTLEVTADRGTSWDKTMVRTYRKRESSADFWPTGDGAGLAAPDLPHEAHEFDFLLGEFDAWHWLSTPAGAFRWSSNATAVRAMDGHAILEFDWHDKDPSLADAATSILRIYNRSMRRWESLFLTNRSNSPLHFGGVREADRIVLHPFAAQTASNPLSQWIFFDAGEDTYRWKGLRSNDRGESWPVYWGIDFVRRGAERDILTAPDEVSTTAADGITVYGDHYRAPQPAAKTLLLFHQGRSEARGEYAKIIERLRNEGFEILAWDARVGGDIFGSPNRTAAQLTSAEPSYCDAYRDVEAALEYAFLYGSGGPIYAIGSSYSAALVIRLAAEHGDRVAGVAAFSPATGRMDECDVGTWLPRALETPIAPFRPQSELEIESVAAQAELFREHGLDLFVSEGGVHGASMLDPERAKGNTDALWERLLGFLNGG